VGGIVSDEEYLLRLCVCIYVLRSKEAGINSGHSQSIPYLVHCVIGAPLYLPRAIR
jgi:hypothetical protein